LTIGRSGEEEGGLDVFAFQIGEIRENLLFCHSGREVVQQIPYGKTKVTDAWLAEHALGIDGYARMVGDLHGVFALGSIIAYSFVVCRASCFATRQKADCAGMRARIWAGVRCTFQDF
jgi:hypothetical protein